MIPQVVFSGKSEKAKKDLEFLRRGAPQEAIDSELRQITKVTDVEAELGTASYKEIFTDSFIIKFMIVGILVQFLQIMTGINALVYFGPTIFKSAGVDAVVFQVILGAVFFGSTFPAVWLVDYCGRRFLFAVGAIGMFVCFMIVGGIGAGSLQYPENCFNDEFRTQNIVACATTNGEPFDTCVVDDLAISRQEFADVCLNADNTPNYGEDGCVCDANVATWFTVVVIIFSFIYIFFFAAGWGPMAWLYCGEIYPNRFRSKLVGITTMANWTSSTALSFMVPPLLNAIQFYTFFIFAGVNFFLIFYSMWLPETKDLPLEKIIDKFEAKLGKWEKKTDKDTIELD